MRISTRRLNIRNLIETDLPDFHIYRSNPDVTRYQGFEVFTIEEAARFIASQTEKEFGTPGDWVQFGIENNATGKIIGDCAIRLHRHDPRIGEIGITISHLEQQKGYAKETLLGILTYLFDKCELHRVVETVDAENIPSINLLKSVGFRLEGHFIDNIFFKGSWGSEYQYAMLRREWEAMKNGKLK